MQVDDAAFWPESGEKVLETFFWKKISRILFFGGAIIEKFLKQEFFRNYASFRRGIALFSGALRVAT